MYDIADQPTREILSHLRHDLVKHLDIPRPGATMTRAGWEVLERRLYSEETGIVALGRTWTHALRQAWRTRALKVQVER